MYYTPRFVSSKKEKNGKVFARVGDWRMGKVGDREGWRNSCQVLTLFGEAVKR